MSLGPAAPLTAICWRAPALRGELKRIVETTARHLRALPDFLASENAVKNTVL